MHPGFLRTRHIFLCLALGLSLAFNAFAQPASVPATNPPAVFSDDKIILPRSVPDPFEPLNRGFWAFNRTLMIDVVKPTAKAYRVVVRKPVRNGISNFGRNITYPVRLLNNVLQGKWTGAREETDRFFVNTVVGAAGFVDVATMWKIPKSDADFGQTLGHWGAPAQFFLMLPIYGPSNDRDTIGLIADTAANPLTYLIPYPFDVGDPFTYVGPYTYWSFALMYNNMSDSVDEYARFAQTEQDPYSDIQYAWTFVRKNRVADFKVRGQQDPSTLETLQTVFFKPKDPEFPNRARMGTVSLPATRRNLSYNIWLQPGKAAIVYIVPGLGSHRLADTALALAELIYDQGYSVVTVSSPYNYEFMRQGSTAAMPAYTPVDANDLHVALTAIDQKLRIIHPGRLGDRALLGYSMGAFETLFLAGLEKKESGLVKFDRYVGINTPVRLIYGVSKLDDFYNAPLAWPAKERTDKIENTFLKVAAMTQNSLTPNTTLPFDAIESKFLVGMVFRLNLRDIIYTSQMRYDQHVLTQPLNRWRREPVYNEIMQYSFQDYFQKFVIPYYQTRGIDLTSPVALDKASDLKTYEANLKANPNIRVMGNRNDFLLAPEDLEWLEATFGPEHLKLFERGGHLGNLSNPNVQKTILHMLDGLQPVQPPNPLPAPNKPSTGKSATPPIPSVP